MYHGRLRGGDCQGVDHLVCGRDADLAQSGIWLLGQHLRRRADVSWVGTLRGVDCCGVLLLCIEAERSECTEGFSHSLHIDRVPP